MDNSILVASLSTCVSLATLVATFKAASHANQANARKVDLEEHRDALERLRKIIEEQDRHVERIRAQLERVQEQLAREQDVSNALRAQIRSLQDQVDSLLRSRARIEDMLSAPQPRPEPSP